MSATLRIEARFKNARLYNAIVDASVPFASTTHGAALQRKGPIKPFCDLHGLNEQAVYLLLNLHNGPIIKPGRYGKPRIRPLCQKLADILGHEMTWLFPADLYSIVWPHLATDVDHRRMITLLEAPRYVFELPPAQEDEVATRELRDGIRGVLHTLTARQSDIIKRRFGLDGEEEHTLEQIAREEHRSKQQISQIEQRALSNLRHPRRSRHLRHHLTRDRWNP